MRSAVLRFCLRMALAATIWAMADWRQIQARIRKAKASTDAAAKLAELYERTRDPMVAFELARWQEKAGEHAEAARWYTAAAERFRRSQWKTKAEAALARLRNTAPVSTAEPPAEATTGDTATPEPLESAETQLSPAGTTSASYVSAKAADALPLHARESNPEAPEPENISQSASQKVEVNAASGDAGNAQTPTGQVRKRPRRRGRRGGRNRRRTAERTGPEFATTTPQPQETANRHVAAPPEAPSRIASPPSQESSEAASQAESVPPPAERSAWRGRSRAGEPALASRMAHLESQLRRLLASPQTRLEQAESAPAGPGVLLLSDAEQVTNYYVEACQTLRIAIGNLVRGTRGSKDMPQLKERLAENLGVAESRVTNYLKEHCAVRWVQLDEGASELAHFAIAVLRPAVND